jgi:hypothetical protein
MKSILGNARRRALLTKVRGRLQLLSVPCSWCSDDCMDDGEPEWMDEKIAVCYSCAELACRS